MPNAQPSFDIAEAKRRMRQLTQEIAADRLRSLIERIERLEEEKAGTATDIREVFAEAKGTGFDVKAMRQVLKLRKMDRDARVELEHLLDLYMRALGID